MTKIDATPTSTILAEADLIEQRIATIAHDMAKLAWAGLDNLQLVLPREKLPAVAMEIASRSAGLIIATAASEKSGQAWIDRMMPLFMQKAHTSASEAYARLMEEAATVPAVPK